MDFDDRLGFMLVGAVIGYSIRTIQEIKKEVGNVDKKLPRKNEDGFMRKPLFADIAILLVVAMCVYASFTTQANNNRLEQAVADIEQGQVENEETRVRLARITNCSSAYLAKTIEALNQRTTYTQEQADANVKLQQAQRDFLTLILTVPPPTDAEATRAVSEYVEKLSAFVEVSDKNKEKTQSYQYPTTDELNNCLAIDPKK